MKRPLAVIGFSYVAMCALGASLPPRVHTALAVALGLCGLLALLSRHRARGYAAGILLASGAACVALLLAFTLRIAPALELAGRTQEVSGVVTRINGPSSIEIRLENGVRAALYAREPLDARVGERFVGTASLARYEDGATTRAAVRRAVSTPLRGFVLEGYRMEPPARGTAGAAVLALRERLTDALLENIPGEEGRALCGMLLGQTQLIPRELRDEYAAAGISHLLAVSGYHMALITALTLALLKGLRLGARARALLGCAAVLCYMAVTGFQVSVQRAGLMAVLMLLARVLGREADTLTSLAAAGLILCVQDPFGAADVSFLLSFCATLAIVLFTKPLQQLLERRLGPARHPRGRTLFLAAFSASLCASAATLPVTVLCFERVPLYTVATNVFLAPLVPAAMACGLLAAVLGALPYLGVLAVPFAFAARVCMTVMNAVVRLMATLPFAQLPADAGFVQLWLAGAAVLCAVAFVRPTRKKTAACAALCAATLMVGILSYQLLLRGSVRLTAVATERSAVLVAVKDGRAAVLGDVATSGDAYAVRLALERGAVRSLEFVALSPSGTRNGAVATLLARYPVGFAVLGEADREDARLMQALDGAQLCGWDEPMRAALFDADAALLEHGGVFAEFEGIKAFILGGDCDILNCILVQGRPSVAVLTQDRPGNAVRLRCDWLVDCAGTGPGRAARQSVPLEPGQAAVFLLKDGRARLLEAGPTG